ncbi:MAG: hypothetical protein ABUR63_10735, partial [Verrucomicrobiota bacterium]
MKALAPLLLLSAACGPAMDLGSNVLWSAQFEGGNFAEWTGQTGGGANAVPSPPNTIQVSTLEAHHGRYAAQLTIDTTGGAQQNAGLNRRGGLPPAAYYSAWYYIPRSVTVGNFWLISKFRERAAVDDAMSDTELYDVGLVNNPATGELTVSLLDHRMTGPFAQPTPPPVVPVSGWFQLEAYYRNAPDASGRLTIWLFDDTRGLRQIYDVSGPMAPNPWVEWDVVNVGENLTPTPTVLNVDDCAISLSRVGPT